MEQHAAPPPTQSVPADRATRSWSIPAPSLPKGGGAIQGIGEKFAANPVNGSGAISVPIATSPGRAGFGPALTLSYDSGAGNGPFGLGWNLGLPAIARATSKGLPRYLDDDESDEFVFSGAESLVPILNAAGKIEHRPVTLHNIDYLVITYRPRIEGLFARIERWQHTSTGASHWRTITGDNVTSIFGPDRDSQLVDPANDRRVFSWLLERTFDDKGNLIVYRYTRENAAGVDFQKAHESHRVDLTTFPQRYLKQIDYTAATPWFPDWSDTGTQTPLPAAWHFSVVFDYGDHHPDTPLPTPDRTWPARPDPFSTHTSGFEIRTWRRCERVLMFHHFPAESDIGNDCLVRSTDCLYADEELPPDPQAPLYSQLRSVVQTGYRRQNGGYRKQSTPPLEFTYSQVHLKADVRELDHDSRQNLPEGIDGARFRLVDLDGEGLPGILSIENGSWFYKRNLSPLPVSPDEERPNARFGPATIVAAMPSTAMTGEVPQFLDLAGDGRLDAVTFAGPLPGFSERTTDRTFTTFQPFQSLPHLDWSDPNLQFVDLSGDGLTDVLITGSDVWTICLSRGEAGFASIQQIPAPQDERSGPRVLFGDGTETIHLADMTGDGLSDIVQVTNGGVCYWPGLGYGRFGPMIVMDHAPRFVDDERYDPRRVRLADIDGSGTTDLLYIAEDGVFACFNQSGNFWAMANRLAVFPDASDPGAVQVADLLGNGTVCLIWSSPLGSSLRYVDVLGGQKPHLMIASRNNLGAETCLTYAPSTRFYLEDEAAGKPWITRLPFPVHVVTRVETRDWIGRSRFVSRYAYHHGYFDGHEREFRGFGMVEQWDTEDHRTDSSFPENDAINWAEASWNPPVHSKTWFHTGAFDEVTAISRQYDTEYWSEPALNAADRAAMNLPDTVLPPGLTADEAREACRALKGTTLRTEIYADDDSDSDSRQHPYSVIEQNVSLRCIQGKGRNGHAIFLVLPHESITFNYERHPDDPRVSHTITLESDKWGQAVRVVAIGYPRRPGYPDPEPALDATFQAMLAHDQARMDIAATRNTYTNAIDDPALFPNDYRIPLPASTITAELTGLTPAANHPGITNLFTFEQMDTLWDQAWAADKEIAYGDIDRADLDGSGPSASLGHRIVQHSRTRYRRDDLTNLLPFEELQPGAIPGESYGLALTQDLASRIFGNRVDDALLTEAGYVHPDGSPGWWVPSGRNSFSPDPAATPAEELAEARGHFYLTRRILDPLGAVTIGSFQYDLVTAESTDAVGNTVSAAFDFRVLQPFRVTDPNGNRVEAAFDLLGLVTANAVRGKETESLGDELSGFATDLDEADLLTRLGDPLTDPASLIGNASSRVIHDQHAFYRTRDQPVPEAPVVYTLARERHVHGADPLEQERFQHALAWSDGFGREVQRKTLVEPGDDGLPRWVGTGWTIFDNKGQPVRTYEPFFTVSHAFEFAHQTGVASTSCRDPLGRVVATLHPDTTWNKVRFDQWRQETWDTNDTAMIDDPRTDPDVGDHFRRILPAGAFTSWHAARIGGLFGDSPAQRLAEQDAATKTEDHANTSTVSHLDARGRLSLTVSHNGGTNRLPVRIAYDAEGKPLASIDPGGRRVTEQCLREPLAGGGFQFVAGYDIEGAALFVNTMDSGERRILHNVLGSPIRQWDAMNRTFRIVHDALQRPIQNWVSTGGGPEHLVELSIYGEAFPERNLRGQLWRQYDGGGLSSSDAYDFKGNLRASSRHLARDYRSTIDWQALVNLTTEQDLDQAANTMLIAADRFISTTTYDALNRPIQVVTPHSASMRPSVIRPGYNEGSLPETVDAWIRQQTAPDVLLDPSSADRHIVADLDYNPKGQRTSLTLGNGTVTTFQYDPATFRLARLTTTRPNTFAAPERVVQDVSYTWDPSGNVTRIRDDADIQNVIYFRNQRVDPTQDFTYDPLYRLIRATGREHLGLTGGALSPPERIANSDLPRTRIPHPGDGNAVATYTETYDYDDTGNIMTMVHLVSSGQWTRNATYTEPSLIDPSQGNNRLSTTNDGSYTYDTHGNMLRMPHLPRMTWDEHDHLRSTTRQVVNAGTPETTWYGYAPGGQRLRKVTDRSAAAGAEPKRRNERIYLGPIEVWREYAGDGATIIRERETLHIASGTDRIALIETGTTGANEQLVRYQYGNHLGSAALELDDAAQIITYEEYFPFGSTSYQAVRNQTETPKRYRFTGKERDEESDLYFHGARYYAPWLGRWTACDPGGLTDGLNVFAYCRNNPVMLNDPGGTQGAESFEDLNDVVKDLNNPGQELSIDLTDTRTHAQPAAKPMGKKAARKHGNKQAKDYRKQAKMKKGPEVQAGHTAAARHAPESGISKADWDKQQMQQLHSRKGKGLDVNVTDQSGNTTSRTRHTSQEGLIDDAVERSKAANGGKLTPQGQLDAAAEVKWRTENVPMDQRDVNALRESGPAKPDKGLPVDPKTGEVVKSETTAAKTEAKAVKAEAKALKTEAKALKTGTEALEVVGKSTAKTALKKLGTKALKVIPFVGMGAGAASAVYEESQGNHVSAALDTVGLIPVVGDVVDAGRLGVAIGETADELLGISDVAAEHGAAVEGAAKYVGLGEDSSRVVGAIGAGVSSITIAPTIAVSKKIAAGVSWLLN